MALTDKEKHNVIFYLGWSGLTLVSGSTQYNSVVNDRLGNLNVQIERIVRGLLTRLEAIDAKMEAATCRLSASEVDSIVLNKDELALLKKERMRIIRELSDHLAIPIEKSGGSQMNVVC